MSIFILVILVITLTSQENEWEGVAGGQSPEWDESKKGSKMVEMSTVSRIQDKLFVALGQYPGGLARKDLFRAVADVPLDKDEVMENQFRLALTGLSIRKKIESAPGGLVKLAEV